jgi:hypothetical protein
MWIIVENTHEAIITKEEFAVIQNSPGRKRKPLKKREKLLLENLVLCKECDGTLGANFNKRQNSWNLNCNKYARSPRLRLCEPHYLPYNKFEKIVLERVKKVCGYYLKTIDVAKLVSKLPKNNIEKTKINREKILLKDKIDELTKKMDTLYDDRFKGIVSVETYIRLSEYSDEESKRLKQKLKELERLDIKDKTEIDYENIVRELINIEHPTRKLLFQIIKNIKVDKNKVIEINYNFKT